MMNDKGQGVQHQGLDYDTPASNGYVFKVPSNWSTIPALYEGHACFFAKQTTSSATRAISLKYVQDTSGLLNTSYSLGISGFSLSVSGNQNPLYTMGANLSF